MAKTPTTFNCGAEEGLPTNAPNALQDPPLCASTHSATEILKTCNRSCRRAEPAIFGSLERQALGAATQYRAHTLVPTPQGGSAV